MPSVNHIMIFETYNSLEGTFQDFVITVLVLRDPVEMGGFGSNYIPSQLSPELFFLSEVQSAVKTHSDMDLNMIY